MGALPIVSDEGMERLAATKVYGCHFSLLHVLLTPVLF
jgi:hypothetical protein